MQRLRRCTREAAERLLAEDKAYHCYCTPEELAADRAAQEAAHQPPHYVGRCAQPHARGATRRARQRDADRPSASVSVRGSWRSTTSSAATSRSTPRHSAATWSSSARTARRCTTSRSSSTTRRWPSRHVIRGEDHLSNTPKHILLFQGARRRRARVRAPAADPQSRPDQDEQAQEPDGRRRLPRRRATSRRPSSTTWRCSAGRRRGSMDDEVLSLDELVERFELERVHSGGAVFDRERLDWLNGQWIRRLSDEDLVERALPFLVDALEAKRAGGATVRTPTADDLVPLLPMVRERLPRLAAIGDMVDFLFVEDIDVDPAPARPETLGSCDDAGGPSLRRARPSRRSGRSASRRMSSRPAARACRGTWLEGRRPVHGHPRRRHRPDRDAAALRYPRGARPRPSAGPTRRSLRGTRRRNIGGDMTLDHAQFQDWLDRYVEAWKSNDADDHRRPLQRGRVPTATTRMTSRSSGAPPSSPRGWRNRTRRERSTGSTSHWPSTARTTSRWVGVGTSTRQAS